MGKYALITGASGSIGRAIAQQLSKRGYSLFLHCNTNCSALTEWVVCLETDVSIIPADFTQIEEINKLVDHISAPLDVIVHNSGQEQYGLLQEFSDEAVMDNIFVNLTSQILLTKRLLPSMINRKSGKILFVSSIWGQTGSGCETIYSAAKGGQIAFLKSLAKETALCGIQVNGVAPGAVETNMISQFDQDELEMISRDIPMGRLGKPEEVAALIAFLASDNTPYLTGQIIGINGGWYC